MDFIDFLIKREKLVEEIDVKGWKFNKSFYGYEIESLFNEWKKLYVDFECEEPKCSNCTSLRITESVDVFVPGNSVCVVDPNQFKAIVNPNMYSCEDYRFENEKKIINYP